ncbi:alpha/beta hydrolase fold protein [Kocuria dechangensis]|uniref:Alpha/beta hydrolase fold protein n=1 Tax=Kocuria dechangensis TaxID=1176249 RepID=A0A917GK96_9MICC|nr:alpha/beta hydrolase [Kocuria dechangensis]GGG48685.1 alpha/beta hydrolase fold protein [Kocuria dechangensis]
MPYLQRSGAKIWCDTEGEGSPLLLIQGLGYPSDASWRILPALAAQHTVILLDNRGTGRSDVPERPWIIADMARDAAVAIEAAGMGPAHVAGFSMGGLIAQELALTRPDLVRSLTLGCTSPGGKDAVPMRQKVAQQFVDWGNLSAEKAAWQAAKVCYAETTPHEEIQADIAVRMQVPTSRRGYAGQMAAIGKYHGAANRLWMWRRPVLVVHGSLDLIVPVENVQVLTQRLSHVEVRVVHGAGHILMTDATDELVETMLAHTARVDSGTVDAKVAL